MVKVVTSGRSKTGPPQTVLPGYLDQPPVFQRPRGPLTGVQIGNVIGASALDPLQDRQLPLGQGARTSTMRKVEQMTTQSRNIK
jgi:hypothetical protein